MASRHLGRGDDFFVARRRIGIRYIFFDCSMKENRILRHHGNLASQAFLRHLGDILVVDIDFSSLNVEESEEQFHERRLSRS